MKLKPIPRSKAKTAYGLVSDVIKAMDEEPKRVNMAVWVDTLSPKDGGPACGTVGCFAGWVNLLTGSRRKKDALGFSENRAKHVLGADADYHDPTIEIDYFGDPGYVFSPEGKDLRGNPGTKTYVRSVIARIKRFQKKNATYLKARKLAGVK